MFDRGDSCTRTSANLGVGQVKLIKHTGKFCITSSFLPHLKTYVYIHQLVAKVMYNEAAVKGMRAQIGRKYIAIQLTVVQ